MKKIVTLLIACLLMCLAGCGESKPVEIPLPDPAPGLDDVESASVINFDDPVLEENFRLVCDQIGIDPDGILVMEHMEDWENGPRYAFAYNDCAWRIDCNADSTIEALYLGSVRKVFDKTEGAYHIDEFQANEQIKLRVEELSQEFLKTAVGIPQDKALGFMEWFLERENNLYHSFGHIILENNAGETKNTYFSLTFENCPEEELLYLRLYILGEEVLHDEMSLVVMPDRMPAVEQTASE